MIRLPISSIIWNVTIWMATIILLSIRWSSQAYIWAKHVDMWFDAKTVCQEHYALSYEHLTDGNNQSVSSPVFNLQVQCLYFKIYFEFRFSYFYFFYLRYGQLYNPSKYCKYCSFMYVYFLPVDQWQTMWLLWSCWY